MTDWTQKSTLIIGAATGIGRATALALAQHQTPLIIADINQAALQETVAAARAAGATVESRFCDISNDPSLKEMFQSIPHLDIALNVAAIGQSFRQFDQLDMIEIRRINQINFMGLLCCMRYEIESLRHGGAIVNVASAAGLVGEPNLSVYAASKHAVVGLTRSVAAEVAARGIRINAVCPGPTATPMLAELGRSSGLGAALEVNLAQTVPIKRMARPEEIAEAIIWLASDEASYVVGAALPVDGGYTAA